METANHPSVVIIGSGLGGLLCGALLAREGCRVTILEKAPEAGGCLQTFQRYGIPFETGFHTLGGFFPGSPMQRLLRSVGAWDAVAPHIVPLDADGFDEVHLHGRCYRLPAGRDRFTAALAGYFPEEKEQIEAYMDEVYRLCDLIPLFDLRMPDPVRPVHPDLSGRSVKQFIESYVHNPELRELLAWNNTLYGGDLFTPDFVAALVTKMYIEGAVRLRDGSRCLADALQQAIVSHGGQVLTNREAVRIEADRQTVSAVYTQDGGCFRADWYISSLHPADMVRLLPEGAFPAAYRNRLAGLRNSYSLFTLFLVLKPDTVPYINRNIYHYTGDSSVWEAGDYTLGDFPRGLMVMTPPMAGDNRFARKMIVHCIMRQDSVKAWQDSVHGARPEAYERFKADCTARVVAALRSIFPEIDTAVMHHFAATPLTLQHYLSLADAAIYGTVHDYRQLYASFLSVRTKISNLLLTGQSVKLHGICGVPVTAVETCGAITGLDVLLRHIANDSINHTA